MITLRRVRAAIVNASVWSAGWFCVGLGLHILPRLLTGSPVFLLSAMFQAAIMAVVGFCVGGAFSVYLALAFKDSRVEGIAPVRFALGGALITALLVLSTLYALNFEQVVDEVLAQPGELYSSILQTVALALALGGITAWGTLKLAQAGQPEALQGSESDGLVSPETSLVPSLPSPAAEAMTLEQPNKR